MFATMTTIGSETLLKELNQLLDLGEPLLTVFPKRHTDDWTLQLPNNISDEMKWYAGDVALRATHPKTYQNYRQQNSTTYLTRLVEHTKAGLLGWCAIGVLK